jgi:gliding motility-associated-like protein
MINNYDSVVSCISLGTPHSQKQESTSYTATKRNWLSFVTVLVTLFCFSFVQGQIAVTVTGSTNTTPALSASYVSLSSALTDLNAVTAMSGPVVLTLDSGTSETAPIKGFVLGSATLNPVLSATNTITINKSGAGAVTINAGVGTSNGPTATPDGMFYLLGADYVTIDGLTFIDGNSASATVAMEFGVAMFKRTAGDGCNNNIVQNCIFNMQRINNSSGSGPMVEGSVGINVVNSIPTAAITALTPTNGGTLATNGTNSNNKFYSNTINGGNYGIALSGFAATVGRGPNPDATSFLGDINNDIGGTAVGTGNAILNFGGGATTNPAAGIRANNQWSVNISYNTINNNNGSGVNHATTLRGIFAQAGISGNATINNNTVTISSGATTSGLIAIENGIGATASSNTVNINNNVIRFSYTTATTGVFTAISNGASAGAVNINGNNIQQVASTVYPSTGTIPVIAGGSPGGTLSISNNTIANFNMTGASGTLRGITASTPTGLYTCTGNTIENLSYSTATSTGSIDGIYNLASATLQNWNNNIIRNFSTPTTGTLQGIRNNTTTGTFQCKNNQIYNFFTTAGGAGGFSANGISWSNSNVEISGNVIYSLNSTGSTGGTSGTINGITSGGSASIYNNKIYNLSSTSSGPLVAGITIAGGTTNNIYNNLIGDLRATAATATTSPTVFPDMVKGINITSTSTSSNQNVYNNTIYLNASSSGTNFGTSGIFHTSNGTSTTSALDLQNNIIINTSTAAGTGKTVAFRRSGGGFNNFITTSNNNLFFAGAPSAANLIMTDNSLQIYQTISDYKNASGLSPRETNSFTEASFNPATFFVSTSGANADFLKPATGITTQAEGGGNTIAIASPDYNGVTRPGTPGTSFDVGAWEFNGVSPAPVLTTLVAAPALTSQCTKADRAISINVTTSSGTISTVTLNYSHNGVTQTAVPMTPSGSTYTGTMIAPGTGNATVTWSISATNSIGLTTVYNGTSYADEPTTGVTATATASVNPVCSGSPTSLSMGIVRQAIVSEGSGALTGSSTAQSIFPGAWGGAKTQYLIRASELTALGLSAGNISSIGFEPTTSGQTYQGFQLWVNQTSSTALTTSFLSNGTLVYLATGTNNEFTPTANSVNTLSFGTGTGASSSFNWDGVSNIVLTFSWSRVPSASTSTSSTMKYDTKSYNACTFVQVDSQSPANMLANTTGATSTSRPRFIINGNTAPSPTAYSWSDGASIVGTTNPLVVSPTAATTYTGTATVAGCPVLASTSVTINPLPTAPTATNSTQCGASVPLASVADPNTFTTPTFKWYDAATAGTLLQTNVSSTYLIPITATTTFYVSVVNPTTGCESARTPVTVTVSTADAIAISGAPTASVCLGQSFTLTPTQTGTNNTYALTWAASTAGSGLTTSASGTLGTALTVTPTATGTYTYSINGSEASTGCTGTATTASITVVNPNAGITATASATPNPVCSGSPTTLSVNLNSGYVNITEGFEGTTFPPTGWTSLNGGSGNNWTTTNSSSYTCSGSNAMLYSYNSFNAANAWMISPVINAIAGTTYTISFKYDSYGSSFSPEALKVTYGSLPTVAAQTNVLWTNSAISNTTCQTVTVSFVAPSNGTYYVGFNCFTPANYWYLSVDDISITGGINVGTPTFSWSDGTSTLGTTNPLVVNPTAPTTYTVNATVNGCPLTASTVVNINPLPTAPSVTASTQCGTLIPTASVADPNSFTTPTFKWYATATSTTPLQTSVSTTYTTAISATTTFHVSVVNPTTGCESARTPVTVTVIAPDPISATANDTSICIGESVTLTATNTATTPAQTYTYSWLSTTPNSGITTAQTGASITVTPDTVGSYTYTATANGGGCQTTATVTVTVNAVPNINSATASASIACAGSTINLAATANDIIPGTATLGAGAITPVAYSYDGIFEHFYGGNKTQFLVTAAELTALGVTPGDITSLGIDMATVTSQAYAGFAVSVASTANTSMTAGINSTATFSPVYSSAAYTPTTGVNTFNFSTPYNWDGSSNIIIQFCWSNNNGGGQTNYALVDTQSYVSTAYFRADNQSVSAICGGTTATGTTSRRPKFIFGGQIESITTGNYNWTWSNGTTNVLTAASGSVVLPASASVSYTATATKASTGCATSSLPVIVTVNPLPTAPTATNSVQCGTRVPTASVSNSNTFASTAIYNWYATATSTTPLQSSTSATFTSLVNTTTTFHVAVANPTTGCESTRVPVTVTVNVPDLLSATANDTTICLGQSVTITTTNLSSIPTQNYTYSWASTSGSGLTAGQTAASFTVTPTTEGSYTYTVTGVDGTCQTTATVTVLVSPLPVVTLDVPSTVLACAGSTVNLGASVVDYIPGTAILGAGATTGTTYDAIFYHLYGGNKVQYLVTAAELTALGITAGDITALGIDMATVAPQAYDGFAVSIASTSNTNMSGGINSTATFSPVYSSASYTPTTGVNTFNFSTPYNWDGSSNILIQFCWSNNNGGGQSNYALVDTQSYVSTAYYRSDNETSSAVCGSTATSLTTSRRPKFIFNAVVGTNLNANYAWTWSNGTTNVLTAASGTVTLPAGAPSTYTATATHLVSGCSNVPNSAQVVATVVSTIAPVGVTTIAPSSICFGDSVNLSLSYTGSTVGLVFQWQSSVNNGISWQDIATATSTTLTTTQSVTTQYRCKMISCGGAPGYSSVAPVTFTNTILGTSAATRCGTGTATINAIASAGSVVNWYASATGGLSLGSGISFTTPSIAATTTYYAAAVSTVTGSTSLGSGGTNSSSSASSFFPGAWGGAKTQYIIKASELIQAGLNAGPITSLGFEPTDSGQTYQGFNVRMGHTTADVAGSNFIVNTALSLVYTGTLTDQGFTPVANTVNNLTFGTGTGTASNFVWDGTSNVVVSISWSRVPAAATATSTTMKVDNVGFVSTNYTLADNLTPTAMADVMTTFGTSSNRPRFTFNGQVICGSPRVPVTVTVTPAPVLTLSSASASICTGSATAAITATGTSNYNTYVWSPATGVSGNSTTGWIFNPTATTTYTLTASQSSGSQCITTATFTVNVNAVPSDITITPANPSACVGVVLPLTATGGVFSNAMLSQSMDVLPANFISSANATITNNTTYFAQGTGSVLFTVPTSASDWLALNQNVNLVGASSATLTFSHIAAMEGSSTSYDYGYVEYSTDGGTTWITFTPANYSGTASTAVFNTNARFSTKSYADWISTFSGSTSTPGTGPATSLWKTETFNIPAAALTSSQFRIRFRYTTDSSVNFYGWLIDDVKIVKSQSNITWSGALANLYTNAAATVPYTPGTNASTVYVLPTTTAPLTYVATSTNGTTNCSKTASITLSDAVAPVVVTRPVTLQLNAAGTATLTAAQVDNGSSDNCSIATLTVSPTSFTCANVGPNTVTLTATDASGNTSSQTAVVTVQDQVGPTVVTRPLTVLLNAAGSATITPAQINNGSTDNCSINTITVSPSTFTCANLGPNTVTLTVTDVNGNVSTGTAIVTVTVDFSVTGDNDLDGSPDNCDPDDDNDGVLDSNDNCPIQANSNQADNDADGLGDACDNDDDNDGVLDGYDNCPFIYNPGQEDIDKDGIGDICDLVEINVSEAITPNGDGVNDTWFINNIEKYPNNSVKVYNRWGDLIFSKNNYQNDWNGTYVNDGNNIPDSSSYYYQIDLDGNGSIDFKGWIYITK